MSENKVGAKVRQLREARGLSVAELAGQCACPVEMLQQIEDGQLAASLAPLIKITRALGVRLGTLLDDDNEIGPVITRAGQASVVTRFSPGGAGNLSGTLEFCSLAAGKSSRHMEPFIIDIDSAAAGEPRLSKHEGEEFIYVLAGEVEIDYGRDRHRLSVGDSIYYDSIVPHQVRAGGDKPARILAVVYAPF
jgi:mannose-6-phosphate isomerase-like protein (cupin superfamily)